MIVTDTTHSSDLTPDLILSVNACDPITLSLPAPRCLPLPLCLNKQSLRWPHLYNMCQSCHPALSMSWPPFPREDVMGTLWWQCVPLSVNQVTCLVPLSCFTHSSRCLSPCSPSPVHVNEPRCIASGCHALSKAKCMHNLSTDCHLGL